jgi:hypothetical protein
VFVNGLHKTSAPLMHIFRTPPPRNPLTKNQLLSTNPPSAYFALPRIISNSFLWPRQVQLTSLGTQYGLFLGIRQVQFTYIIHKSLLGDDNHIHTIHTHTYIRTYSTPGSTATRKSEGRNLSSPHVLSSPWSPNPRYRAPQGNLNLKWRAVSPNVAHAMNAVCQVCERKKKEKKHPLLPGLPVYFTYLPPCPLSRPKCLTPQRRAQACVYEGGRRVFTMQT